MNDHAGNEHRYDPSILPKEIRDDAVVPCASNLIHHILRGRPSNFIRCSRVKVTGRTEEETREGDERESL